MDQVMIEASMFIHRDSFNQVRALANARALENVVVPHAFARFAGQDVRRLITRLRGYYSISPSSIDLRGVYDFLPGILEVVPTYRPPEDAPLGPIYENLLRITHDALIAQILFEEFSFLTSHSWLFAKVRRAYDDIVEVGCSAFQTSKAKFDTITRRLLNKSPTAALTPNDKLKAGAKWIAVGGPPY